MAPSSWDEHYRGHEDDSNHPYPWFDIGLRFLLVVVVILLLFLRTARQRRFNSGHPQHQTTVIINGDFTMRQNGANGNNNNTTNTNTTVLTLEDRVALYKKTFETNGNQLKLQPKHIIVHQNTGNTSVDGNEETQDDDAVSTFVDVELGKNADDQDDHNDNGNDEDDLEQSTHLALASARNLTQQQDDGMHNSSSSSDSSSISSSSSSNSEIAATTKLCLEEKQEIDTSMHTNITTNPTISGTCVICFEQFEKDDMIVWSEDPTW